MRKRRKSRSASAPGSSASTSWQPLVSLLSCPSTDSPTFFPVSYSPKLSCRLTLGMREDLASTVKPSILWLLGDVLEREWLSRRLVRRLEMLRHLSRRSLCHRTHIVVLLRRHLHLR
ncbi:hypothetical protein Taro_019601 [Colocasia esculenta]|uniref:Uncharacterized protein n=1 Tax=Colocasia esculenta TaxID=4460 RepID=A0A843V5Z7_COLES|nr:hypothetical protein [Colocasia esculenta]